MPEGVCIVRPGPSWVSDRRIGVRVLEAVFWDVDGTLADTELDGHRPAFNRAFQDAGLSWVWDRPLYEELLAIPGGRQRMAAYAERLGQPLDDSQLDRLRVLKQRHYLRRSRDGAIHLRPGVRRLIASVQASGIPQWIVTSSGAASVAALLDGLFAGVGHPFAGIISADDVGVAKPDPEPYRMALLRSGADASAVLAIEDSEAGLLSASGAGITCLLTPSPWERWLCEALGGESPPGAAALDHLGEPHSPARQLSGPPCPGGMVTLEYLQSLLPFSC